MRIKVQTGFGAHALLCATTAQCALQPVMSYPILISSPLFDFVFLYDGNIVTTMRNCSAPMSECVQNNGNQAYACCAASRTDNAPVSNPHQQTPLKARASAHHV
eukprot:UN3911